jgi:hypothetical protein
MRYVERALRRKSSADGGMGVENLAFEAGVRVDGVDWVDIVDRVDWGIVCWLGQTKLSSPALDA